MVNLVEYISDNGVQDKKTRIVTKSSNTFQEHKFKLKDQDDKPRDLTNAEATAYIANKEHILLVKPLEIDNATEGIVKFHFYSDENIPKGDYFLEIRVTYDGGEHYEVFPSKTLIPVTIVEDLFEREKSPNVSKSLAILIDRTVKTTADAVEKGNFAKEQGDYALEKGDYALEQGDYAKEQGELAEDIVNNGTVVSVNGKRGVVTGIAEQSDIDSLTSQLNETNSQLTLTETELTKKMDKNTADISVSQINKNLGKFDESYMSETFLQQMTGNTPINATVAPKSLTTQRLADKAISSGKTTFIKRSSNLFNKNDVVLGKVIGFDGVISDNTSYGYSHIIEVTPNTPIYTIGVYHIIVYDIDMVFKQRINIAAGDIGGIATSIPNGGYYVRCNFNPNTTYFTGNKIQVNYGSVALPYESFYEEIEAINLNGKNINFRTINNSAIEDHTIKPNKMLFVRSSTNLLDKSKVTVNASIDTSGKIVSSTNNNLSDYIEVTPKSTISTRAFSVIYYFDRDKKYLGSHTYAVTYSDDKWEIPADTYFIRGRYPSNITQSSQAQINEGSTLLPYESYFQEINDVTFSKKIKDDYLYEINDPNKRVMLDMPINGVYRTQTNMLTKWNYTAATTSAEVYSKYDELMAQHPDYITKESLGNDNYGNPISLYKFSQGRPTSVGNKRIPTVYLTAGVHGSEIISPFGTWLMFNEICNNWQSDPLLEALRFNVNFLIIPVAVPTGFEDLTRWNRNGVDINRNFDVDWVLNDSSSGSYSGPEPFSEPETRIIASVYGLYPNIDIMYDLHNFGTDPNNYMLWVRTEGGERSWYLGENLITLMTREWRKTYDFIPSNLNSYVGWVNAGGQATVGNYARSKGIQFPGTLEVANKIYLDPNATGIDENLMKTTVEAYVNWILILLRELASNNKTIL